VFNWILCIQYAVFAIRAENGAAVSLLKVFQLVREEGGGGRIAEDGAVPHFSPTINATPYCENSRRRCPRDFRENTPAEACDIVTQGTKFIRYKTPYTRCSVFIFPLHFLCVCGQQRFFKVKLRGRRRYKWYDALVGRFQGRLQFLN